MNVLRSNTSTGPEKEMSVATSSTEVDELFREPLRSPERDALLTGIERIAEVIRRNGETSERERMHPRESLEAMREVGLFKIGAPRELGGTEVDPLTQAEVVEAVARLDGSAGW